jgi:hypothetical protein
MKIKKNLLSEISIYHGKVDMPEGFEIEKDELVKNIFLSQYYEDIEYPFSKNWDKLKTYICDFIKVEHNLNFVPIKTYGSFFEKNEISKPRLEIDLMNLKNSVDFVFLYGVEIDNNTCEICVYYDDNKNKGKNKIFKLNNNSFIIFPSSLIYTIQNKNNTFLNFIQTINFKIV